MLKILQSEWKYYRHHRMSGTYVECDEYKNKIPDKRVKVEGKLI